MNLPEIINQVKHYHSTNLSMDIRHLKDYFKDYGEIGDVLFCPEFQRGNIWTEQQQIAFVENLIRGCQLNNVIYLNDLFMANPNVIQNADERLKNKVIVVDGLQRLTAIFAFIDGKIKLFDNQVSYQDILQYEDKSFMRNIFNKSLIVLKIINIANYAELLEFYINFNSGGTVHDTKEIERIKKMLSDELK